MNTLRGCVQGGSTQRARQCHLPSDRLCGVGRIFQTDFRRRKSVVALTSQMSPISLCLALPNWRR